MDIENRKIVKPKISCVLIKDMTLGAITVYALILTIIAILIFKQILVMPSLCRTPSYQIIGEN
jgi:hypothetical protein